MINTKHLRVGNYVEYNGEVIEVESVGSYGIDFYSEYCDSIGVRYKDTELSPITLTEEWLENFGFTSHPHKIFTNSWSKSVGRNKEISISDLGTPNMMMFLKQHEDVITLWNWDFDKELPVHTLQNVYFSLSKEEL